MFDEQNQNPSAPKNLPAEPVDMFAGVEKNEAGEALLAAVPDALDAGLLKKKNEVKTMPNLPSDLQNYKTSAPILGKVLVFLFIILLLGGFSYGAWWFFAGSKNQTSKLPTAPATQTDLESPQNTAPANTTTNIPAQQNNDQILFGQAIDSDKDGLDDVREKEIGSDPQKADSDGDGLNDGDEVIIYKTSPLVSDTDGDGLSDGDEALIWRSNPLNPDTDGDSYPDGTEVRNGYSPTGPGKLFSAPTTTPVATSTI
ncbi:MAG: Peptidoglycan-associated outer membrane protein [Candidatus Magasanikbacteria bacterium GW2011_GWA2_40_10]|uniref:Peptidoglycan-associated outer membrane protein n=1 Tax=Candidatus Magasanikbacteria bacterium GW2011_GWA2_40_10 TaxID=1619037 RepID=A0A0G0SJ42_9BACT|nr:MAG: Peptidoglycan-associated outer membrane protein [Candidatus Magasanikbacteria bacterium GW2011_GWA2_40_10]